MFLCDCPPTLGGISGTDTDTSLACIIYIICGIAGCITKFSSSFVQRAPTGKVGHR